MGLVALLDLRRSSAPIVTSPRLGGLGLHRLSRPDPVGLVALLDLRRSSAPIVRADPEEEGATMLGEILRLTDQLEGGPLPGRTSPRRRDETSPCRDAGSGRERRLLMAGGRTARGSWTWVTPEAEAARRALPGPWALTLLLRGRPAGGSPP